MAIEKCQKCGKEKRIIINNGQPVDHKICIKHDITPGICPQCGKELRTKTAEQCPHCQSSWHEIKPTKIEQKILPEQNDVIHCPKCNSTQIAANQKGFGAGKAIVGAVLTGGIGLLGGFIGSKSLIITCLNCGNKWKPGSK
jgi:predicted Zn-ribbon and HTH transcriptional regulator